MGDTDIRAARDRIETVEKRIAAMQDAGVDTAALRAQLAFAHHGLREGRLADIEAICDEVLAAARRLAELGSRASQVRTPAYGTPVQAREPVVATPAAPSPAPPGPGTEAVQRIKVGRAQLAEEVRAVIDAEIKAKLSAPVEAPAVPAVDLAPLDRRLAALEAQLQQAIQRTADTASVAGTLDRLGARLADLEARPAQPADDGLAERVAVALNAVTGSVDAIAGRLAALESRPTHQVDEAAIAAIVTRTVNEAVPRQASELLREAIVKLPTRDDLHQIAETLRADLDWRLEKAAAEHGWCSLQDVQSSVRKAMSEQDPAATVGGSQLGRLEIALAEFVQQSKDQQERLIAALADRVAQHTKSLTKRMLVREPVEGRREPNKPDTEELSPSLSVMPGEGSSRMAAITGGVQRDAPTKSPTEFSLDPVSAEHIEAARREHGSTTMFTKRMPVVTEMPEVAATPTADVNDSLHDLVTAEVERALSGATASTMSGGLSVNLAEATTPGAMPTSAPVQAQRDAVATVAAQLASPSMVVTAMAGSGPQTQVAGHDLAVLIAAEVGRQMANTIPVNLPPSDSDLARAVARALPQALQDENVRTELFAVLALEAAGKPGVLGELTGLRRYLKRELQATAAQLGAPVPVA